MAFQQQHPQRAFISTSPTQTTIEAIVRLMQALTMAFIDQFLGGASPGRPPETSALFSLRCRDVGGFDMGHVLLAARPFLLGWFLQGIKGLSFGRV